jgi:hypothetical protein
MTIKSFRSDARRHRLAVGQALTGLALAAIAFCAQGATDSSIEPARASLPPAPLSMSPALIELSASTPRVVVSVHNDDIHRAMFVRMQPLMWTQDGTAPHYELTPDVIARPAAFVVAPGATQVLEVELRSSIDNLLGQDFKLFWQAQAEQPVWQKSEQRAAP